MSSIQGILRNVKGAHNEFILLNTAYNKRHNAVKNISSNVNLLMLSEIKIDDSFPEFGDPFRFDRNVIDGGILFYVREDIQAKLVSVETLPTESFFC